MSKVIFPVIFMLSVFIFSCADDVFIYQLDSFPAYPYNTGDYWEPGNDRGFPGCGPTTGAMILGYFNNIFDAPGMLELPAPDGVDQGLASAWILHGEEYMATGANGYGDPLNIESGIEDYVADRGGKYEVDVMLHVSPTYQPDNPTWNQYGEYGRSWTNDAYFYKQNANGSWYIDKQDFYDWTSEKLRNAVPVFLTIDYNDEDGADHWVPMIGAGETDNGQIIYYYYNTFDTQRHNANAAYVSESPGGGDGAIAAVRTITFSIKRTITKVIIDGDTAPDGSVVTEVSGRMYGILKGFDANDNNNVVYIAKLENGRQGIFTSDGATIALSSMPAPGGGSFSAFYAPSGVRYTSINNNDETAFFAILDTGEEGIFTENEVVAKEGEIAPNGELYERFDGCDINNNGLTAFMAVAGAKSIFTRDSIILTDNSAPGGGTLYQIGAIPVLRDDGSAVYLGAFSDGEINGQGVFSTDGINYGRAGDNAPGGGIIAQGAGQFNYPDANSTGDVAYLATLETGEEGIYTSAERIAIQDGQAPGGKTFTDIYGSPGINDAGYIVFAARTDDGLSGIFDSKNMALVKEGDIAFDDFYFTDMADPVVTNTGAVVFYAEISDGTITLAGLFIVE